MGPRLLASALGAVLAAGAIGACGSSSNGIAAQPASQILSATESAAKTASSVHIAGALTTGGQPLDVDLKLVNGKGASGTIATSAFSVQIIDVANTVYVKGSDSFWQRFGGASAVRLFHGKWLKTPANGNFAAFAQFADLGKLFDNIFPAAHGTLTKGGTSTVDGQAVVAVSATGGGTLYVATSGKPYPVQVTKSGAGGGHIDFTEYDQSFSLAAPKNAVDISQFQ